MLSFCGPGLLLFSFIFLFFFHRKSNCPVLSRTNEHLQCHIAFIKWNGSDSIAIQIRNVARQIWKRVFFFSMKNLFNILVGHTICSSKSVRWKTVYPVSCKRHKPAEYRNSFGYDCIDCINCPGENDSWLVDSSSVCLNLWLIGSDDAQLMSKSRETNLSIEKVRATKCAQIATIIANSSAFKICNWEKKKQQQQRNNGTNNSFIDCENYLHCCTRFTRLYLDW